MAVYLMAHDLGTTGNKATLFSVDGTLVAHTVYPYPTRYFNSTWAEQDPRNWCAKHQAPVVVCRKGPLPSPTAQIQTVRAP